MTSFLFIPWFRFEQFPVPLPFTVPGFGDSFPMQPFMLLIWIGVLLGIRIGVEVAKRNGVSPVVAIELGLHGIVVGFVGAFVLNTVFYDPQTLVDFFAHPERMHTHRTGLSSYGGFFGAAFGVWIWAKRTKLPVLRIGDAAAFSLPFGWIFGRLGCFVVHDHPGHVTDFFLAVDGFRVGHAPFLPRHDLGFYEVLWAIAVSILFAGLFLRKNVRPSGFYLALELMLYAPVRFALDFLRAEASEGGDVRYGGLTPGQYSSIVFFLIGAAVLRKVLTEGVQPIPAEWAWPPAPSAPASEGMAPVLAAAAPSGSSSGSSAKARKNPRS